MPRTIESIVASHRAGSERSGRGLSPWEFTISFKGIFPDGCDSMPKEPSDEQAADLGRKYADLIRSHASIKRRKLLDYASDAYDSTLDGIVELLECVCPDAERGDSGLDDLNERIDELYDWADANRVWIEAR